MNRTRLAVPVALACVAGGTASCGGSGGPSLVDQQRATLETIIRDQLGNQVERQAPGVRATVLKLPTCAHRSGGSFDCVAEVFVAGAAVGGHITQTVGVSGTCDDTSCTWEADQ